MRLHYRVMLFSASLLLPCGLQASEDKPSKIVRPSKRTLIGNSTLLASSGKWTLVPKGSVLYVPKSLNSKIVTKPKGKLLSWNDFIARNGSWIHLASVKMKQAQGREIISQEMIKQYSRLGKIVIATYSKAPISVSTKALIPPEQEELTKP